MDLRVVAAVAVGATFLIDSLTDAEIPHLLPQHAAGFLHIVLLEAEPEGRKIMAPSPVCSFDDGKDTICGEAVVR